ncbi:threonine/serine exporter family protein [Clostridium akagii]|uniref:threonine/serine exporter family protein n=1 Tax=Clostridium akagii TaxID=91623 RepID=UPI000479627D|nr:threonine/serine exporter family protein [Clostridium akagii]
MILATFYSFLSSLCFAFIFNIRGKNILIASIGGSLSWLIYLIIQNVHGSNTVSLFVAAFVVSIYSEVMARVFRSPVTTYTICGIIPLVPGGGMYDTMFQTISGNISKATLAGLQTLTGAGAIAIAMVMVSSLCRLIFYKKKQAH